MTQRQLTFREQLTIRYREIRSLLDGRAMAVIMALLLVFAFAIGYVGRPSITDTVVVTTPAPGVTTIQVPKPVITESIVNKYIKVEDRTASNALLAENDKLNIKVRELNATIAELRSKGNGTGISECVPATNTTPAEVRVSFKDWRLDFSSVNNAVNYSLTQKFSIISTTGRNRDNVPTHLVRAYEIGPNNERFPLTTVETTTLAAAPNVPRLYSKFTVQGGVGYANGQRVFVMTPWLKYGRSTATEDTRWAFLTPAVSLSANSQALGVAPLSFNLGSLPRQPFTNIWVSPFIGTTSGTNIEQKGVAISVTF